MYCLVTESITSLHSLNDCHAEILASNCVPTGRAESAVSVDSLSDMDGHGKRAECHTEMYSRR